MKLFIILLLIISVNINSLAKGFEKSPNLNSLKKITAAIEKVRSELNDKSGIQITVVNKNETVYSNSFGYADSERKTKITKDTPFYIASTTKSLVASLILILEKEGKIDIDAPIKEYLPEDFQFDDPNLSTEWITVRDLLTHRTGLQNQIIEIRTTFTGQQNNETLLKLFSKSRYTGRKHNYSNLNYIMLGIIIDRATNSSWKKLLNEKLFVPLEMNNSFADFKIDNYESVAKPHSLKKDYSIAAKNKKAMFIHSGTLLPSGGVFSTSENISNYMKMILNNGLYNDKEILSKYQVNEALANQSNINRNFPYEFYCYGIGWEIADYTGKKLATHNGSNRIGYKSYMAVMPETGIGISIISNENVIPFFSQVIIANYILNIEVNPSKADTILDEEIEKYKLKLEERIQKRMSRQPNLDASKGLKLSKTDIGKKSLEGKYVNPIWGEFDVRQNGENLHFQFGNLKNDGIMIKENQFKVDFGFAIATVSFVIENNNVKGFKVREIGAEFLKSVN